MSSFFCTTLNHFLWLWVFMASVHASVAAGQPQQSNIIIVNLDDADWSMFEHDFSQPGGFKYFPNIHRLASRGMRFSNFHVTTPICGPSRACLLTGQYAHRLGIYSNQPDNPNSRGFPGGYNVWRDTGPGGEQGVKWTGAHLGKWMQMGGYRTMAIGKYLHSGFEPRVNETWEDLRPDGWDESYLSVGSRYYNPFQVVNGAIGPVSGYRTDIESTQMLQVIRGHQRDHAAQPFFLYLAPLAPHAEEASVRDATETEVGKGMVAMRHRSWWPTMVQPFTPDFNEWDMSDKPAPLRELRPLILNGSTIDDNELLFADNEYRRRMLSLRAVDEMIGTMQAELERQGIDDKTVVMLTSDNGYMLGQHRLFGKATCLDRATRVPLFVWGEGISPVAENLPYLMAHIDIAPTLLDLAGISQQIPMPGKSFLPLLNGEYSGSFRDWRPQGILLEHFQRQGSRKLDSTCCGVRLFDSYYGEWSTGDDEYYDLAADPYQLENVVDSLDTSGRSYLSNLIRLHKQGMPSPVSHIESPFGPEGTFSGKTTVSGTAQHRFDVESVQLVIREIGGQRRFWNGAQWQPGYATTAATLAANDRTIVEWSYEFDPAGDIGTGRYYVASRTYGVDGQFQPVPDSTILNLASSYPYGQVSTPARNTVVKWLASQPLQIGGWAVDSDEMRTVRLVLRNTADGRFWNGQQWQVAPATVPATRAVFQDNRRRVEWTYDFIPAEFSGTVSAVLRMVPSDSTRPVQTSSTSFSWGR